MKPVMRSLSPQLQTKIDVTIGRAYKRGSQAGWVRGFRVGALLSAAVLSTAGLLIGGAAWVLG
jgi:hypothetical protein